MVWLWPICLPAICEENRYTRWTLKRANVPVQHSLQQYGFFQLEEWIPKTTEPEQAWCQRWKVQCRRFVTTQRILGKQQRACVSDSGGWQLIDRRKTVAWGLMLWWDATQAEAMTCQSTQELVPEGTFASFWNQVKKTTKIHTQRSLKWKNRRRSNHWFAWARSRYAF